MKVTALKIQVKNPERVSVFIDGKYSFSLTQNQLLGAGLRIDKELSEAELEKLKQDSEFGKAYMRALDYVMRRPRSEKELRDYAWRKKWEPDMAEAIIEKLKTQKYLNDTNFAKAWVRHRALGKPMSQKKLKLELRQKGIEAETIEQTIDESEEFDELVALRKIIAKKRARYPEELKLKQYLARQGFSFDDINRALKED
jgi:regulatory protein